jgi:hypothetical protein
MQSSAYSLYCLYRAFHKLKHKRILILSWRDARSLVFLLKCCVHLLIYYSIEIQIDYARLWTV